MDNLIVRRLGLQEYANCWQAMQAFTNQRNEHTPDEIWLLEHSPVFTQGQNGKPEHIINPGNIPIVQTDRGGQITYHGPGQLMVYTLIDIKRKKIHVREFVSLLEQSIIDLLNAHHISGYAKREAPGVYIQKDGIENKLCSIGLRIRRGCTYHGIAFNVAMDLGPFLRINPCGFTGLKMTQFADLGGSKDLRIVETELMNYLAKNLRYNQLSFH
jgi:lipoyl(octanoyl) transferase